VQKIPTPWYNAMRDLIMQLSRIPQLLTQQQILKALIMNGISGTEVSGTGSTIIHNYNQPGQYMVKHIITDSLNTCVDSASQSITISFTPFCTASFLSDNFFPALNKFVFASTSFVAGTAIKNYTWKISNTVVGTNNSFVYTFPSAGTYNVCLKIETFSGCISEHCEQVQVFGYCNKNSSFTTSANLNSREHLHSPRILIIAIHILVASGQWSWIS
jgi:hypothetical protein